MSYELLLMSDVQRLESSIDLNYLHHIGTYLIPTHTLAFIPEEPCLSSSGSVSNSSRSSQSQLRPTLLSLFHPTFVFFLENSSSTLYKSSH
jgi:hypothetical protein